MSQGENENPDVEETDHGCDKSQLMLSALQLVTDHFPIPGRVQCQGFIFSKDKYKPVTEKSPMFGIDCEWCLCRDGKE